MADGKGYYISGMSLGDKLVEVNLVYGEPSTERRALLSPVQEIEKEFTVGKYGDIRDTVFISSDEVNGSSVSYSSPKTHGASFRLSAHPTLQRLFDFYLLVWLSKKEQYSHDNGIRFGISKVLDTDDPDKVKEHLLPGEQVFIELPKVRVEGLDDILEQAEAYVPMAPLATK